MKKKNNTKSIVQKSKHLGIIERERERDAQIDYYINGKEIHLWSWNMLLCDFKLTRKLGEVFKCIRFWFGD